MTKTVTQRKQKRAARKKTARAATPIEETAPRQVMVLIHGGGDFPDDWYKPLVAAIEKELGRPFDYLPVYYADIGNATARSLVTPPEQQKFEEDFKKALQESFQAAQSRTMESDRAVGIAGITLPPPVEMFAKMAKEIGRYLFDPTLSQAVQARLSEKLDRAMQTYDEIVLASLSLGSVISFDVLKRRADRYKISCWFSCGCPLGKLRALEKYDANLGAITSQTVARWYNVYDNTDVIADALGPWFPIPGYRLHDIFVDVAVDPVGSHDYFNNSETIKMLADAMR